MSRCTAVVLPALIVILSIIACGQGAADNDKDRREGGTPSRPENGQATTEQPSGTDDLRFPEADPDGDFAYRIIGAPNGTFGYDVLKSGRLFIHQTNIPGMPGIEGCRTEAEAVKLAEFVIGKMKQGEMPPSVTQEELKTLGIE